jgi:hypothetical protein
MVREDVLFAELAKNSDLRIEFNQQVQLQNVAMTDMRTITPPAESTNSIFSSLGFSIPSKEYMNRIAAKPANALQMSKTAGGAIIGFWKKYAVTVAAIILTAGLTTSVFMLTDDRFATTDKPVLTQNVEKDIPVMSSQTTVTDNITQRQQRTNFAGSFAKQTNAENNSNSVVKEEPVSIAKTDINSLNSSQNIDIISAYRNDFNASSINQQMIDPLAELFNLKPARNFNDGNFALLISYPNTSPSNVNISNNLVNNFETNVNITALYKIGDNWYVGASLGKENFAMNFNRDLYGEKNNQQQNPALFYYGLTARYSANLDNLIGLNVSQFAKPYLQLYAGSTSMLGFLGSGQLGITLTPYNNIALNLGYEVKSFYYQVSSINTNNVVNNKLENTIKNGLVFGLGMSF